MESVAELLKWVLENLNYWVVTIFMAIESSFIPFPSEAVVPPAAWKAMADDSMNIFLVVLFATIGADIGALVNYYLARWLGRPIIYKFANSRNKTAKESGGCAVLSEIFFCMVYFFLVNKAVVVLVIGFLAYKGLKKKK